MKNPSPAFLPIFVKNKESCEPPVTQAFQQLPYSLLVGVTGFELATPILTILSF